MFAVIFEHPTVLELVKWLFCLEVHSALGNGCISSWMCKKMQEQRTCFIQLLKTTRQTEQLLLSESDCWLENLPKPMQVSRKCVLLSPVWQAHLGIPLFYDAYHTMNNVELESDGKDEHHLESWKHVSQCCRAWLSRLFLMQCVVLHNKGLEGGGRSWHW